MKIYLRIYIKIQIKYLYRKYTLFFIQDFIKGLEGQITYQYNIKNELKSIKHNLFYINNLFKFNQLYLSVLLSDKNKGNLIQILNKLNVK